MLHNDISNKKYMDVKNQRCAGILMHITSLPSKYGIGTLGKQAFEFVDFLTACGQRCWQVLPIGHTSSGDSPYQSFSSYAGNPYFIDLDILSDLGLLNKNEYENLDWFDNLSFVNYKKIYDLRYMVLKRAYNRFKNKDQENFNKFIISQQAWLDDYALFMALKKHFNMKSWINWDDPDIKFRKKESIVYYENLLLDDIMFFKWIQFMFYSQWYELKKYANLNSIKIIGDLPIYPSLDSADVWVNTKAFKLDDNCVPTVVAGFPPDNFSKKGQLWGNPVYDWDYMKNTNYKWWIDRLNASFKFFDILRLDHFRGFESFYTVEYKSIDAVKGKWQKGPGIEFFNAIKDKLSSSDIIAEDLGHLTCEVKELLKKTGYPGMRILQYGFDGNIKNEHLVHNYEENTAAFTGTHDNDTIMGWFNKLSYADKKYVIDYIKIKDINNCNFDFIKAVYASRSRFAIIPMQDVLGLLSDARMNIPSTVGGNWRWRAQHSDFNNNISEKLRGLCNAYHRL